MASTAVYLDCFVLHCHHDNRDCRHAYGTMEALIVIAANGLRDDHLQSVSHVTYNGLTVMRQEVLQEHIDHLHCAPYN